MFKQIFDSLIVKQLTLFTIPIELTLQKMYPQTCFTFNFLRYIFFISIRQIRLISIIVFSINIRFLNMTSY